jgi:hypothetical protein
MSFMWWLRTSGYYRLSLTVLSRHIKLGHGGIRGNQNNRICVSFVLGVVASSVVTPRRATVLTPHHSPFPRLCSLFRPTLVDVAYC